MSNSVKIVAFANDAKEPMLINLVRSLEKYNYDYKIVGIGSKWEGFMTKIKGYLEYTKTLDPNQLVVITDAYDVLATGPPGELISNYKSYGKPLVVGAESYCGKNCIPVDKWWNSEKGKEREKGKLRYVNSGFFMGPAYIITKTLNYMVSLGISDDQEALCIYVNDYPDSVSLDINAHLISNITPFDFRYLDYDFNKNRIVNKLTDTYPAFVHTPGKTGDLMIRTNYVGSHVLGEDYSLTPTNSTFNELINKFPTFVMKNFTIIFFVFALIVIILILLVAYAPLLLIPAIVIIAMGLTLMVVLYRQRMI